MSGIILDSDILIELLRGRNIAVNSRFERALSELVPLFHSAVSVAEIAHGARDHEARAISALLGFSTCLAADCVVAADAGVMLRRFHKSHGIGMGDAVIAATAIRNDLLLWTRNRKHYPDQSPRFVEAS